MTLLLFPMVVLYIQNREPLGIFIMESYKQYNNTLTSYEQKKIKEMYDAAEGEDKKF